MDVVADTTRLLLIEDNRGDYLLTRELLKEIDSRRFVLDWEQTFEGGLALLAEGDYDVCLVDYTIGGDNGTDFLQEAQRNGNTTPLIMLTGMVNREIDEQAKQLGAADCLVKNEVTAGILDRAIRHSIERARLLTELAQLAKYDPLTGLANRTLMQDFLHGAMARARRSSQNMAVLLIDIDHFKHINDELGHDVGDGLLKHVAHCLKASVRAGDLVARLGGDEFVVILDNVIKRANAGHVASKILEELGKSALVHSHEIKVGASIGVACYDGGDETAVELVKGADAAMYEAKRAGRRGYRVFVPQMLDVATRRAALEAELVHAIDADELELHYQPQIAPMTGKLVGLEALVRWRRGQQLWSPGQFIPMAEEANLIQRIDKWVLGQACQQIKSWRSQRLLNATQVVAVNISAQQLSDPNFPVLVATALSKAQIEPGNLELELTESTMLRDPELAIESLSAIHMMGVRIAIDDFGTGYSSLSYLKRLPVHTIKIDRSFIQDIGDSTVNDVIITSTIELAHTLGMIVVAEGVETPEQAQFLLAQGCCALQGFHFFRPAHRDATTTLLENWSDQHSNKSTRFRSRALTEEPRDLCA